MKTNLSRFLVLITISFFCLSLDHHRWPIKTSPHKRTNSRLLSLDHVIKLEDPPGVKTNDKRYELKLIPPFANSLGLKEGDLIKIKGYMHLVAYEKNDDEYHIQISDSKTSGDNCLIVEVPDPKNTDDEVLKVKYEKVRAFIREKILKGNSPGSGGNIIGGRAYVYVTGQLFYDFSHTHNQIRGKAGMRSYSLWEIHPVIDMNFAVKP